MKSVMEDVKKGRGCKMGLRKMEVVGCWTLEHASYRVNFRVLGGETGVRLVHQWIDLEESMIEDVSIEVARVCWRELVKLGFTRIEKGES